MIRTASLISTSPLQSASPYLVTAISPVGGSVVGGAVDTGTPIEITPSIFVTSYLIDPEPFV